MLIFSKLNKVKNWACSAKKKKRAKLSKNHWRMFCSVFLVGLVGPLGLKRAWSRPSPKAHWASIKWVFSKSSWSPMLDKCGFGAGPAKAHRAFRARKTKTQQNIPPWYLLSLAHFFFWLSMLNFLLCLTLKKLAYIFHPNFVMFSWGGISNFCSVKPQPHLPIALFHNLPQ